MARSRRLLLTLVAACLGVRAALAGAAPAAEAPIEESYKQVPGPHRVRIARYEWEDERRRRTVPAKAYVPDGPGPFPLIIFSHGAGGSREGYEYLGRHWASHGYVGVHLQHAGSDDATWRGRPDPLEGIRESIANPMNAISRVQDVSFAIDTLEGLNESDGLLAGRLDTDRIGMAGHSFGAWTTLAVVGQVSAPRARRRRPISLADPRVKAAIPMSAPAPTRPETWPQAYAEVGVPCLHMTGTLDYSIVSETTPEQRRVPFDHIDGAPQFLVTFNGGDHMVFSGRGRGRARPKDAVFQDLIRQGTAAFWDAYLKDDEEARAWLTEGGYASALGNEATLELKDI